MGSEMDTFAARLATFDTVLKPDKRRSSGLKGPKSITWPHKTPSPAELAHAGFYYKPYETNPDNTTCFHCHRALDGWEVDDNAITEHLTHAPDCAWAIIMDIQRHSSNPAEIEDPTSDRIAQARLATFRSAWPHEGKRGWLCQSEKMVAGGWYFCPTEESNDLASCAYCKLSLDGWEPKDDPFDEHYRRSADCSFFIFSQPPTKKSKKTKKPRVSKASRLSTQSVATVTSETPEMDVDDPDRSVISISQSTTKLKPTKKSKGKGRGAKSKKEDSEEVDSQMDVDSIESAQPEPPKPKRATRGRKRVSEEISHADVGLEEADQPNPSAEPPAKRRATRSRSSSVAPTYNYEPSDYSMLDAASVDEALPQEKTKKGRKPSKRGAKSRKLSDVSTTSQATARARMPRDSEIDAALEAGLAADNPESEQPEPEQPQGSKKTKAGKKSKAAAKTPAQPTPEVAEDVDHEERLEAHTLSVEEQETELPAPKAKADKASKKKGTKKANTRECAQGKALGMRESVDTNATHDRAGDAHHESFVSGGIIDQKTEPVPESAVESAGKAAKTKSSKKKGGAADKAKKSKKTSKKTEQPLHPDAQDDAESFAGDDGHFQTPEPIPEVVEPMQGHTRQSHRTTANLPPKTAKRYSDMPSEKHLAESLTESQKSRRGNEQPEIRSNSVSPLPVHQSTPSMSPQSSDAENRPPSTRPSAMHAPVSAKEQRTRTPLVVRTPSPSKRNALDKVAHPWTPMDVDELLFGDCNKENADLSGLFDGAKAGLTSPEKKMTVEEWIRWNAKNGEERLKRECERLVYLFEKEGGRAMRRLEAIECMD